MKSADESAGDRGRGASGLLIASALLILLVMVTVFYFVAWPFVAVMLHAKMGVDVHLLEATIPPIEWLYETCPPYHAFLNWGAEKMGVR